MSVASRCMSEQALDPALERRQLLQVLLPHQGGRRRVELLGSRSGAAVCRNRLPRARALAEHRNDEPLRQQKHGDEDEPDEDEHASGHLQLALSVTAE